MFRLKAAVTPVASSYAGQQGVPVLDQVHPEQNRIPRRAALCEPVQQTLSLFRLEVPNARTDVEHDPALAGTRLVQFEALGVVQHAGGNKHAGNLALDALLSVLQSRWRHIDRLVEDGVLALDRCSQQQSRLVGRAGAELNHPQRISLGGQADDFFGMGGENGALCPGKVDTSGSSVIWSKRREPSACRKKATKAAILAWTSGLRRLPRQSAQRSGYSDGEDRWWSCSLLDAAENVGVTSLPVEYPKTASGFPVKRSCDTMRECGPPV